MKVSEKLDIIRDCAYRFEWSKEEIQDGKEYDKEMMKSMKEKNDFIDELLNMFMVEAVKLLSKKGK